MEIHETTRVERSKRVVSFRASFFAQPGIWPIRDSVTPASAVMGRLTV